MDCKIIPLNKTRFQISYGTNPALTIDFDRVLAEARRQFPDQTNFVLKHWQSRPTGQRRWGVFCVEGEQTKYLSYWPFEILGSDAFHCEIQVGEGPPPTAVICYPGGIFQSVPKNDHRKLWRIASEYRSGSTA